ncbi:molybdopterin-binding protein [Streptomyces sp. DSM 42041]|uniref:Molybdopterin molybdenumtransferase n=1 Tax=Streptomyces hazeniae TaxID=3075538 RepID=A0ABU2NPX0_9ACTN|nr:molybdopterin-binding protein [Streptomyces sp. DSM 42041]MDT0379031.1 molybdopterin-binding protein [Streptomyces sp. DSM 42041]
MGGPGGASSTGRMGAPADRRPGATPDAQPTPPASPASPTGALARESAPGGASRDGGATAGPKTPSGPGCARVGGVGAVETGEEARVVDSSAPFAGGGEPARPSAPQPPPAHADVPWAEAQRIAARAVEPAATVTVPLDRAVRQVLAAPVEALADLPSFDTSAMDGWAVAGPGPWTPAGLPEGPGVLAGGAEPEPLADGRAVRIATGARIPPGATAVVRDERAELRAERLHLTPGAPSGSTDPGTDIRPRGQECRTGARLLPAGTPVTPPVLGLAAAAGYDRLTVTPRPRAEVLVLGDELLHEGLPSGGRIRDALGPMVGPWLSALGAEVLATRRLGDDPEALHEAVTTTGADLVVTTGGTAHGPLDHVRPALHRIGARLLVDGVEVRPGHPMLLAALAGAQRGRHLVGLPGNPLAAVSGLLTLAGPLLRARAGLPEPEPVRATLTADVQGHPRDTRLVPVIRTADGSGATPLRWTGPAMLRGLAGASALAAVAPGGASAGMSVRLLELPW